MAGLLPPLDSRLCLLVVGVGALSAVAGIVLATAQKDIKRVLAYSSVENLGIIGMGVGLGFLGRSIGRSDLALLGIGGALLHAWNHGLFKPLLFLGAGAVIRQTGTRDIETMGGLAKKTPLLAGFFILGSAAICALPPLNGFTSEFLLYVGFFRCLESGDAALTWDPKDIAAIAAAVLAMVGALAAACFVRLYSTVFSGEGRSEAGLRARENGTAMMVPMAAFGALCLAFGVAPAIALPAVGGAAASWLGAARETEALPGGGADAPIRALADLAPVSLAAGLGTVASAALAVAYVAYRVRRRASRLDAKSPRALGAKASAEPIPPTIGDGRSPPTWDCGYAAPTSRMQYTASSFGETIVTHFAGFLRPRKRRRVVDGPYPAGASFESQSPDAIIERAAPRARRFIARFLPRLRSLQTGLLQSYILYILAITIVLLLFGGPGALR